MDITVIENEIGCHTYIECDCHDFDHIVKLGYINDEDEEFYIDFKHQKYPILDRKYYNGRWYILYRLKNYISNIWYAIKGRSNRYALEAIWSYKQANQIKQFIEYCTIRYNLKKGE